MLAGIIKVKNVIFRPHFIIKEFGLGTYLLCVKNCLLKKQTTFLDIINRRAKNND